MIKTNDIGRAIVEAGLTFSDGAMRENHTVVDIVNVVAKLLTANGITVVTPADEEKYEILRASLIGGG